MHFFKVGEKVKLINGIQPFGESDERVYTIGCVHEDQEDIFLKLEEGNRGTRCKEHETSWIANFKYVEKCGTEAEQKEYIIHCPTREDWLAVEQKFKEMGYEFLEGVCTDWNNTVAKENNCLSVL